MIEEAGLQPTLYTSSGRYSLRISVEMLNKEVVKGSEIRSEYPKAVT
jgi:hypothetical protein